MKKINFIIGLFLILSVGACKKTSDNPEEIRNKIIEYKKEVSKLNAEISELEKLLGNDTLQTQAGLTVNTVEVMQKPFVHYITVTANVDAENIAMISPQMNGQIVKIYVKEGQRVKKGQLLAKMNDEVLKSNLAQLETSLVLADTLYQKQKKLYEQNVISEVQYLEAKNKKEAIEKNIDVVKSQIAMSQVKAPFSGIIDKIYFKEGEIAVPGKPVFLLVNLNTMIATAEVSEKYIPVIHKGDPVQISFPTYPDLKIDTKVYETGNVIDPVNRTFWLKVKFKNIDEKIKPNMLATVKLKDFETDNAIVVPTEILSKDINGWFLFVAVKKGDKFFAQKRYVEIGISDNVNTIVKKGLNEGDLIITKGFNQVADNMIINAVTQN